MVNVQLKLSKKRSDWREIHYMCRPVVSEVTKRICAQANAIGKGTYRYSEWDGWLSPHGTVYTGDARSMANNRKNNTLLKAMY